MGQTLYWECNSGISGDMAVASLLDLGADETVLRNVLDTVPAEGFRVEISRVKKSGLDVCDFSVKLDEKYENHDSDMKFLFPDMHDAGHEHDGECEHGVGHDTEHRHGHEEAHDAGQEHGGKHDHEHDHAHAHRGLADIRNILARTDMSDRARQIALDTFQILAQAEAKAHGVDVEDVHFHEVGAVDSIVDIVSVAVCLDNLDITRVIVPYLCEGRGNVRCQHGILPIPVPAVTNIVQQNGLELHITDMEAELVTPTGAAIVAAVMTDKRLPERFAIRKSGMGAGKRNYSRPSILRAMMLDVEEDVKAETSESERVKSAQVESTQAELTQAESVQPECTDNSLMRMIDENLQIDGDYIYKLETNIDDCTGEVLGYVCDLLFESGARDVFYTPVYMKKNRPAYLLTVICSPDKVEIMENIIFRETTTIGIRKVQMARRVLPRTLDTVETSYGTMQVKCCVLPDGTERVYPEYESAAKLAREHGVPIREVLKECGRV